MIRLEQTNKNLFCKTVSITCDKLDFDDIRKYFEDNICVEVLVKNRIFYCYKEDYPEYANIDFALKEFGSLPCLSLHEFWKNNNRRVVFSGCNEWVVKLVPLLVREGVNVKVDEIWNFIWDDVNILKDTSIEELEVLVNANAKSFDLYNEFSWVMDILQFQRWKTMNATKAYFSEMGAKVLTCTIPEFVDLKEYTPAEEYRNSKQMNITNGRMHLTDEDVVMNFQKVYGDDYAEIRQRCKTEPMNHWMQAIYDAEYYLKNRKVYSQGKNRCYLVGPCIIEGNTAPSGGSFPELVQKFLDRCMEEKYAVMTISIPFYVVNNYLKILQYLAVRSNDILICIDEISQKNITATGLKPDIDFKALYDNRSRDEEWFADKPIHTSVLANKMLSKYLVDFIKHNIDFMDDKNDLLQYGKGYLLKDELEQIEQYLNGIDLFVGDNTRKKIGAIVMNCNPITLGHQYLIDYAKSQVDYLYIFVVQEDKSYITFEDRINLVRMYVGKQENIKVNPSGTLILSSVTMPMYFEKEEKKNVVVDAWKDVEIFAQYIAPRLGISVRFVGEEKTDMITWQYNREMERTLQDYGIEFREIPRKEFEGVAISASNVRRLLIDQKWEELRNMVSDKTYTYLKEKYM